MAPKRDRIDDYVTQDFLDARLATVGEHFNVVEGKINRVADTVNEIKLDLHESMDTQRRLLNQTLQSHTAQLVSFAEQHTQLHNAHDLVHKANAARVYAGLTIIGVLAGAAFGFILYHYVGGPPAFLLGGAGGASVFVGVVALAGYTEDFEYRIGLGIGRLLITRPGRRLIAWYVGRRHRK